MFLWTQLTQWISKEAFPEVFLATYFYRLNFYTQESISKLVPYLYQRFHLLQGDLFQVNRMPL